MQFQIGAVSTVVEMSGGATLIQTESARISDLKSGEVIRALSLALRRLHDFYQLSPQVSKPRGAWYIRFAGSRNNQGEEVIDGATTRGAFGGASAGVTNNRTESYQEVRIDMAGHSAEFAGIGQISIVTRAGTNEFHGAALDNYATPGLIARNPFSPAATGSISHGMGVMAGGPVYLPRIYNGRNRTFFFALVEFALQGPAADPAKPDGAAAGVAERGFLRTPARHRHTGSIRLEHPVPRQRRARLPAQSGGPQAPGALLSAAQLRSG